MTQGVHDISTGHRLDDDTPVSDEEYAEHLSRMAPLVAQIEKNLAASE